MDKKVKLNLFLMWQNVMKKSLLNILKLIFLSLALTSPIAAHVEQITISLEPGWNLISIPVQEKEMKIDRLFPLSEAVYEYLPEEQRYNKLNNSNHINSQKAYWVKMPKNLDEQLYQIKINGEINKEYQKNIYPNYWYMQGSLYQLTTPEVTPPENNTAVYIYKNGRYEEVKDEIKAGQGFWIITNPNTKKETKLTETYQLKMASKVINPRNLLSDDITADYLMVVANKFSLEKGSEVRRLAKYRAKNNHFNVAIVKIGDIFTLFPSEIPDIEPNSKPESLKSFLTHAYYNWSFSPLGGDDKKFLLFIGDADLNHDTFMEWEIPIYKTEHFSYGENIYSDKPFSMITENISDENLDLICDYYLGRLPVREEKEIKNITDKIIIYESPSNDLSLEDSSWINKVAFVNTFDPEDYMYNNAKERLSDIIKKTLAFGKQVAYLDANLFKENEDLKKGIIENFNDGRAFSFIRGHGGDDGWYGKEFQYVLETSDIPKLNNKNKPSLALVFNCLSGNFLNNNQIGIGENLLLDSNGVVLYLGGAYATSHLDNEKLVSKVFENIFTKTCGQIFFVSKIFLSAYLDLFESTYDGKDIPSLYTEYLKYHILGDPALSFKKKIEAKIVGPEIISQVKNLYIPKGSKQIKLNLFLENQSETVDSNPFSISVYDIENGDRLMTSHTIESLSAGESLNVNLSLLPIAPGKSHPYIKVNIPNNLLLTYNNIAPSKTFYVGSSIDLSERIINFENLSPEKEKSLDLTVRSYAEYGYVAFDLEVKLRISPNETFSIYYDNTLVKEEDRFVITPGQSKIFQVKAKSDRTAKSAYIYVASVFENEILEEKKVLVYLNKDKEIKVPEHFEKIQDALDVAVDEDTILISDGTYKENLKIKSKQISIIGNIANPEKVIIESNPNNYSYATIGANHCNIIIKGLTVQNSTLAAIESDSSNITLENIIIRNNRKNGPIIDIEGRVVRDEGLFYYSLNMKNILIADNTNTKTNPVWDSSILNIHAMKGTLNNITLANNKSLYSLNCYYSNLTIKNSIFWDQKIYFKSDYYFKELTKIFFEYSTIKNEENGFAFIIDFFANPGPPANLEESLIWGEGNLAVKPIFVDPDNDNIMLRNYRLKKGSPGINSGLNHQDLPQIDLDGKPRIIENIVDMGAYEYQE